MVYDVTIPSSQSTHRTINIVQSIVFPIPTSERYEERLCRTRRPSLICTWQNPS